MKNIIYIVLLSVLPMLTYAQIDVVSDGRVGVGTANPHADSKLHVDGGNLILENGRLGFGVTSPARPFHMRASNSVFRIDRDGNSPGFILARFPNGNYNGDALQSYGLIVNGYENGSPGYLALTNFNGQIGGASDRVFLISQSGSLIVDNATAQNPNAVVESSYRLHVQGDAFKSGGGDLWSTLSDKRLKRNIKKYEGGLDIIKKLNPVTYEYNGKAGTKVGQEHVGVVAQELQKVAPQMVSTFQFTTVDDGGIEYIDGKSDGKKVNHIEKEYLSINASSLKWIIVNAIKEQQETIASQDETIKSQDEKIATLEERLDKMETLLNNTAIPSASQTVELGASVGLLQNQPNPFNETTTIKYTLPQNTQNAKMRITDMNGKVIKIVELSDTQNGELIIKAGELSMGTYSYSLIVNGQILNTKKMVLAK